MLDAARKALEFVQGRGRTDLDTDEMFELAVIRLLEVLGEAARGVSKTFRQSHPQKAASVKRLSLVLYDHRPEMGPNWDHFRLK